MDKNKQQLSVEAARLYYDYDYSQQEIANKLMVSRPTVSRLLRAAKKNGYIQIKIMDPFSEISRIEKNLKDKYKLKHVEVAFSPSEDYDTIIKYIGQRTAEYLNEIVKDGDIIGVIWGKTMHSIANNLIPKRVKGVEVVQLKGGVSHSDVNTYALEIIKLFGQAYNTVPKYLPLPVIFDNVIAKNIVQEDRHIKKIIEMGKQSNIAIFTVGDVCDDALLFRLGYFNKQEESFLKKNAVGDICSRFFNSKGEICSEKIDNRTVGIELNDLRSKENTILTAGGCHKIRAIHGALCGKYANTFITDQYTAKKLLDL